MKTRYISSKSVLSILLLLALFMGLAGCSNTAQAQVLDEFIQHMATRDASAAYALFSSRAKSEVSQEDLDAAAQGQFGDLVQGYESLSVTSIEVSTVSGRTTADLSGTLKYADGSSKSFSALMDKEGDAWLVTSVNIE